MKGILDQFVLNAGAISYPSYRGQQLLIGPRSVEDPDWVAKLHFVDVPKGWVTIGLSWFARDGRD
jgi:hypothetical protein